MHKEYFEGILQLRNPTDEITNFIMDEMRRRPDVLITKQKKVGDGFDLFFTNQHFLQSLGKQLHTKFFGDLKVSKKLYTRNRQTSRETFRVTVFFRHYPYNVGGIFMIRGEKYKIMNAGKKITAKNMDTGKNLFLRYEDLK